MDSIWSHITTLATGIAVAIFEVLLSRRAQKYRQLTLIVNRIWRLDHELTTDVAEDFREIFGIHSGDLLPLAASFVSFSVANTGRLAIRCEDFDRPLRFSFGENAQILRFRLVKSIPLALRQTVTIEHEDSQLLIAPILLNQHEQFTVKVIGLNFDAVLPVGRFVGMSEIGPEDTRRILFSSVLESRSLARGFLIIGLILLSVVLLVALLVVDRIWGTELGLEYAVRAIVGPLLSDVTYRRGFFTGLLFAFIVFTVVTINTFASQAQSLIAAYARERAAGRKYVFSDR